jgi:hypothetical protein
MSRNPGKSSACRKFEARFEGYLGGAADLELQNHVNVCAGCRSALADAILAADLLRESYAPVPEARLGFTAGVMAKIAEEKARRESPAAFWTPLEFLASRLSLTAAVILLLLSGYLIHEGPGRGASPARSQTELSASDFPQPPGYPVSNEEVLQSLAERSNGR